MNRWGRPVKATKAQRAEILRLSKTTPNRRGRDFRPRSFPWFSMREIAQKVGLSKSTVARVLSASASHNLVKGRAGEGDNASVAGDNAGVVERAEKDP